MEQSNLRYRASLVKANGAPSGQPLMAHCFPNNSTLNLTTAEKNSSPCINGMIYNDSLPSDFLRTNNVLNGISNFDECVRDVKKLFAAEKKCQTASDYCSFHDVFISDVKPNKFVVIESFKCFFE